MGFVEDELKQLKDVFASLDLRIKKLEQRALGTAPSTEEIRMILIGPPGAGWSSFFSRQCALLRALVMLTTFSLQAREPRPLRSRSDFPAATW